MTGNPSKRMRWLLAGLVAFGVVAAAQAALINNLYVPIARNLYPETPTPTIVPGVYITTINFSPTDNPMNEYVVIQNYLNARVDLTEWTVRDENRNICTIGETSPSGNYTLLDDAILYLWTKDGMPEVGIGDHDNLFCAFSQPIWNDHGDRAVLKDGNGEIIDDFSYGSVSRSLSLPQETTPVPPAPTPSPTASAPLP